MFQEALQKIRHFLILIWYFLRDKPPDPTIIEEKLGNLPKTQVQRVIRRWERSRARSLE